MTWSLRIALKSPATWIYGAAVLMLLAVMPSDRESSRAMFEEACNTSRAFALFAAPLLCGALWGSIGDARSEQSVHLAGAGYVRQRVLHMWTMTILVVAAPVILVGGCMVRWLLFHGPTSDLSETQAAMSSSQTFLYLLLTLIAVLVLTAILCPGRTGLPAVSLAIAVPLIHTVIYFGVDVPGVGFLQNLWPTTAAGVVARGPGDDTHALDGVIAALAIAGSIAAASWRLSAVPSFDTEGLRLTRRPRPQNPRTEDHAMVRTSPPTGRSRLLVVTSVLAVGLAGLGPVALTHLPAAVRPSLLIQREEGTDPVSVARDFIQAAQQGDLSRLGELTESQNSVQVAREVPAPILRGLPGGVFTLELSARVDEATVEATYSGDAIHIHLQRLPGRWVVVEVTAPGQVSVT